MSVVVDRLEKHGYAVRTVDETDRRAVLVRITDAGREVAAQVSTARDALLAERLDRLAPAERRSIVAALAALDRLTE